MFKRLVAVAALAGAATFTMLALSAIVKADAAFATEQYSSVQRRG